MARSPCMSIDPGRQSQLLRIARESIATGLRSGSAPMPPREDLDETLGQPAACFVTLKTGGELRGCIGSLEADQPLAAAVSQAAFAAAFRDPRFPPLSSSEFPRVSIEISVLSPMQALAVDSEEDLLAALRPGVDGLVLQEGARRATYLPSVWEMLPRPRDFVRQLKVKGDWGERYWSAQMRAYRFQTLSFGEHGQGVTGE